MSTDCEDDASANTSPCRLHLHIIKSKKIFSLKGFGDHCGHNFPGHRAHLIRHWRNYAFAVHATTTNLHVIFYG